jgi:tight adherence protein B
VNLIRAGAAFVLVLAVWSIAVVVWQMHKARRAEILKRRLGLGGAAQAMRELRLWRDGKEASTLVPGGPDRLPLSARMERLLREAGWKTSPQTLLVFLFSLSAVLFAVTFLVSGSLLFAAAALAILGIVFRIYLERCVAKRKELFENQLVDGLELAARSLRAGHPLMASFRLISEEIDEPIGTTFAKVCQQQSLGLSLEDALRQVADESGSQDLKLFATSVVIQIRSGGNLADMMERVAAVVRQRMQLGRHFRVITTQVQLSKRLLLAIPFVLFGLISIANPDYMRPLFTAPLGRLGLCLGAVLMIIGARLMSHMARLRY